ncbi:MAG: hypothetical protein P8R54_29010 [Myxococcota bacterium]|nr:hypothetical protein [Myxococcota bacterium]
MAKKKRSKRQSIRNSDFFNEPLYGMDLNFKSDDARTAGPTESDEVDQHGEEDLSEVLARALKHSGREERETHGFHTYPAGMHPDCAADIIAACPGAVHDPFCGGGTVLVEGILANRPTSGTDIAPIALLVAATRTAPMSMATPLRAAARRVTEYAKQPIEVAVPEEVVSWYEPHVAQELGRLRDGILKEDPAVHSLLRTVFSSILIKTSFRDSDTSSRRTPTQRPPGTTLTLFHKKARLLGRALECMPQDLPEATLKYGDARVKTAPSMVDLILTSPPYPGVYDYLPMQQLRYAWLGLNPGRGYIKEIGSRRAFRAKERGEALKTWQADTTSWVATQAGTLNPNGRMAIVVGDGLVAGRVVDTLYPTIEAMEAAGLTIIARVSTDRPDHARNTTRTEHIIMGERQG